VLENAAPVRFCRVSRFGTLHSLFSARDSGLRRANKSFRYITLCQIPRTLG